MMYTVTECIERVKFADAWVKKSPKERLEYYQHNPPRQRAYSFAWLISDELAHQMLDSWVIQLENELKWETQRKEAEEKASKAKAAAAKVVEIIHEATLVSGNVTTVVTAMRLGDGSIKTETKTTVA